MNKSEKSNKFEPVELFTIGRLVVGAAADRAKEDPEKLVTPGIIYLGGYIGREPDRFRYATIGIGWWDWAAYLMFAILPKTIEPKKDNKSEEE